MKKYRVLLSTILVLMVCLTASFAGGVSEQGITDYFKEMPSLDIMSGDYNYSSSFDGSLQASLTSGTTSEALYGDQYFKDGIIKTNFVVYNGNNAHGNGGVMFRTNDFNANGNLLNGYYAGVKPASSGVKGCVMLGKFVNGQWHLIKEVNASVNVGNNQSLTVEAQGSHILVYHDGKKSIDVYDYAFTHGGLGFRTWQIPAVYKDFVLESIFKDEFTVQSDIRVEQGMFNKVHTFGGSLQGNVTDNDTSLALFEDETFEDGIIETNMVAYRGDNVHGNSGIVFRVEDYTDEGFVKEGYSVSLKAKSSGVKSLVILGKYRKGKWKLLKEVETNVNYGENYNQNLRVEVTGDRISIFHDGMLKITYFDDDYTSGDIGVYSHSVPSLYKDFSIIRGEGSYSTADPVIGESLTANGKAYENTFDSTTNTDLQLYGGDWYFAGSAAQVKSVAKVGGKATVKNHIYDNFELTSNVVCGDLYKRSVKAYYDAGVIFRVTNPQYGADNLNGYYYGFGPNRDKLFVGKFVEGKWSMIKEIDYGLYGLEDLSYDQSLREKMIYELKVRAVGSQLSFYLNGKNVFNINDNTYTAGSVGTRLYANAKDCWAAYYDFKVVPLNANGQVQSSTASASASSTSTYTPPASTTTNTSTTSTSSYRKAKTGGVDILNTEKYAFDNVTFAVSFTYNGKPYYTTRTLKGLSKDYTSELVLNDNGKYNGTTTIGNYMSISEKTATVPSWEIQNCTGDIKDLKSVLVLKIGGKDYRIYKQWDDLSTDHMYKIVKSGDTYVLQETY